MATTDKRLKQAELQCKQANAQLTPIRKALLSLIYSHDEPLSAYELLHLYRKVNPKAESMTVYRALDFLQKQHFIHRLASQNSYKACDSPDERHHAYFLICEKCEQAQEVLSTPVTNAVRKLTTEHQFVLSSLPVEMIGVCRDCMEG